MVFQWRGGCDGAERRFAVKEGRGLAWRSVWVTGFVGVGLWRHRSRKILPPAATDQALRSARPMDRPRAWLLPAATIFAGGYGGRVRLPELLELPVLPEFLFADGGDEFLEVEGFEVGYVLEVAGVEGCQGGFQHCGCFRLALAEAGVGVLDDVGAFAGSVTDEEAWALGQVFCEAVFVDDCRGGSGDLASVLKDGGIDFHAAGVDHRDDEAVGGSLDSARDDRGRTRDDIVTISCLGYKCVEGSDGKEGLAGAEAEAFGCRDTYAEAGV